MKKLALLALMIFATGCSMDASLMDLGKVGSIIKMQDPAKTTGLVSGSTQTGTATGTDGAGHTVTYKVQSTVGSYMSAGQVNQTTSDGTYRVYSSVQLAIVGN